MSFSNIQQLYSALQSNGYLNLSAKTFNLPPSNALGSASLNALLGNASYFPSTGLGMTGVTAPAPTGSTIVITGSFSQTFLGSPTPVSTSAIFYLDNSGNAQLDLVIVFEDTWTFSSSFSGLAKTQIDSLAFTAPSFVLASVADNLPTNNVPLAAGLNFAGNLSLSSEPLTSLSWLWSSPNFILSGSVTLPVADNIPAMTLATAYASTGLSIGTVALVAGVAASSADNAGTAVAPVSLISLLNIGPTIQISISGTIPASSSDILTLQAGSLTNPLASLNDLAALVSGQSLSAIIPSQIPLGNSLQLVDLQLQIIPSTQTIVSVAMDIGLNLDWTIIPNLVQFQDLVVTFTISDPVGDPTIFAAVNATFTISSQSTQQLALPAGTQSYLLDAPGAPQTDPAVIALGVTIPSLVFSGGLQSGTIDLISTVVHFFRSSATFDTTLNLTTFNFQLNVTDRTYSVNAVVETGDILTLDLGPSIPFPKITIEQISLAIQRTQTGFGATIAATTHFLNNDWTISASRTPDPNSGWTFSGMLNPNQQLTVQDVVNGVIPASWGLQIPADFNGPAITAFSASFNTAYNTFAVSGALAWTLTIIPNTLTLAVTSTISVQSNRASKSAQATYSGLVTGDLKLNDIELQVQYAFAPNSSTFTFIFEGITAVYTSNQTNPNLSISFGNMTLGDILAFLIRLGDPGASASLPSPWNALNAISLNGLQIQIFFKTKSISISYPINLDLGFIKLNKIGFTYSRLYGQGDISLILDCNFLGTSYSGNNALAWNPTQSAPPATPGAGAALFDLQYLGLGQHVSLRDVSQLTTVTQVINALKNAVKPISDPTSNPVSQLPGLEFNSGSNWLIGAQFSIMGTFSMSLVFNDPEVYGLLIGLSGEKAGVLAGLSFEILYRKVTDKIGVYHIELKLPDAMRQLQFGSVSITLPVITIDIYTNGNFRIDFGFPTSPTDTSRCFGVQVFPFVGVGGFYFAMLSGATSSKVPKIDNGTFNPVIEAGIALFIGVGKTLSLGILSGGISVTVNGIIQGVYAKFEPNDKNIGSATYFWLQGTIAIVGNVYATVDFGIIQASVSLTVYASVTLTVQVYQPILIQLSAGVTVSVSIKILFIRISFHFSATINASFTIGSASTPPWHVVQGGGGGGSTQLVSRSALRNARFASMRFAGLRARPRALGLPRALKAANAASPTPVKLMFTPVVTKAQASDFPNGNGNADGVAISAMLFVNTATDPTAKTVAAAKAVAGAGASSGFNVLMQQLLEWTITTIGGQTTVVTLHDLEDLYKTLGNDSTFDNDFTYTDLSNFLAANVTFEIDQRPTSGDTVSAAFFPMIPGLSLTTPTYSVNFGGPPLIDSTYETFIQNYFNDLAVEYANSVERNPTGAQAPLRAASGQPESLPTWLFRRYFLMLAKGVVQAAIDFLNSYTYTVADPDNESLDSIANKFQAVMLDYTSVEGDTAASIAKAFNITEPALINANPGVNFNPLAKGTLLHIPIQVMVLYVTVTGDTLDSIAAHFSVTDGDIEIANPNVDFDKLTPGTELQIPVQVTPQSIVSANSTTTGLLRVWATASSAATNAAAGPQQPVLNGITYSVVSGDTLGGTGASSISQRFSITPAELAGNNLNVAGLFAPGASVAIGNLVYTSRNGDTLQSISAYYGLPVTTILTDNTSPQIVLRSTPAQTLVIQNDQGGQQYTVAANDTVESVTAKFNMTVDKLLELNTAIFVASGQSINLTAVTHTVAGAFMVPYVITDGDTLLSIVTRYFAPSTPEQLQAAEALVQQWNPQITDWTNLVTGTTITFPIPDSLFSLQQYYVVTLATILTGNQTSAILATRTTLAIPPISPAVAATDSFQSLAQRYAITLDQLATALAPTSGLFHGTDKDTPPPQITIPYVPAMQLDQLVSELGASSSINQSAAMTSRFMLHGLRIPQPPASNALAQTPASNASLVTYPMFVLLGQEFPIPTTADLPNYSFQVTNTGSLSWATLPDGKGGYSPTGTLDFTLSTDEQTQITEFQTTNFQPENLSVQRLPLSAYVADQTALQNQILWQAGELPVSSCFTSSGQISGQPTLWPLPDALQSSVAAGPSAGVPYQLVIGQPNQSGGFDNTDANCYTWAASIDVQLSRVPVEGGDNPYLEGTYLVNGADQTGAARLLQIWQFLNAGDSATLYLLYKTDPSAPGASGYVSDALNRTNSVLLKTNLSTLSHESVALRFGALDAPSDSPFYSASLQPGDSADFLQLMWECSVVKSGGFYLTYQTSDGKTLPDRLFQQGNEATVSLLVVLGSQVALPPSLMHEFNNMAVLGDNIDVSRVNLFARTVVPLVGENNVSTLQQIATAYPGYKKLALSPASLAVANADITNLLQPGATFAIPNQPSITIPAGATFQSIAHGAKITDIGSLGTANATNNILQDGALLQLLPNQLHIKNTVPPGTSGFLLTRDNPEYKSNADRTAGAADPQTELNTLFNLLGFNIVANASFAASGQGLPAGPTQDDQQGTDGLSTRNTSDEESPTWTYRQALSIYQSALQTLMPTCTALPDAADNPYAGIQLAGGAAPEVQLALNFQELHGNRTLSGAIPNLTCPVGYIDELLTVSRWPSTASAFAFNLNGTQPDVNATFAFSAYKYMPSASADYPQTHDSSRADREKMQTAYFQVRMPDVGFSLATTMGTVTPPNTSDLGLALTNYVSAAWLFLATAAELPAVTRVTANGPTFDTLGSVAALYDTDPGSVAEANSSLSAVALFGQNAQLTIPEYYRFRTGDTFLGIVTSIIEQQGGDPATLLALMATSNESVSMQAGTALNAKTRTVTVHNADPTLASVQAISDSQQVSITDVFAPDGTTVLVTGLATANQGAILTQGITLTLNGATLQVGQNQTLGDVANSFGNGAQPADVCVANRYVQSFFAENDSLTLPNYLVQANDTLLSIATNIGPATPVVPPMTPVVQLVKDNENVANLFTPGTTLYYGSLSYTVQGDDTMSTIATQFAITIQDLGMRNASSPTLEPQQTLRIPYLVDASAVQYSTYQCLATDTFGGVAGLYPSWTNGVQDLATFNANVPALFNPAQTITIGTTHVTPKLTDTFATLAPQFSLSVPDFASAIGAMANLVRTGALIYAPAIQVAAGSTLNDAATKYNAQCAEIADANASVYNLLASGQQVVVAGYQATVMAGDTFTSLAAKINAARVADHLQPYVRPSDIGRLNPGLSFNPSNLVSPVRAAQIAYPVTPDYTDSIRPVHVTLTMTRNTDLVDPEFTAATQVFTATSSLTATPYDQDLDAQDNSDPVLSLQVFASDFEAAFAGFKLATGADQDFRATPQRAACGQPAAQLAEALGDDDPGSDSNKPLWCVNLGNNGAVSSRFNYQAQGSKVQYYSLPPLSTQLWDSNGDLTLQTYKSGTGLTGTQTLQFHSIDVDQWAREFLSVMDRFLSPEYAAAVYALDQTNSTTYFTDVVGVKADLANNIKQDLSLVLVPKGKPTGSLDDAKEALYQQLLIELSSAYTVDTIVQYPFQITSGCSNPKNAARLSGKPLAKTYRTPNPQDGIVNLSDVASALGVSLPYLGMMLADIQFILNQGIEVTYGTGQPNYTLSNSDTIGTIANYYNVDVQTLAATLRVVTVNAGLMRPNTVVNLTSIRHQLQAGDKFASIAARYGTTVPILMLANQSVANVFTPNSSITLGKTQKTVPASGSPADVAALFSLSIADFAAEIWSGDLNGTATYTLDVAANTTLTLLVQPPVYSFTTGKVPLANGSGFGTFLFNVQDPALSRSVFLDLDYAITAMEYDIVDVPGTGGYQDSAWLSFIIPIQPAPTTSLPNDGRFGLAEIPVPLRAYPGPYAVSKQQALPQNDNALSAQDPSYFEWKYQFQMARQAAAQDSSTLTVILNSTGNAPAVRNAAGSDRTALFQALAQYAFVAPAVIADLGNLLLTKPDSTQQAAAASAVKAFAWLAGNIRDNWKPLAKLAMGDITGEFYDFTLDTLVSASKPGDFAFLELSYVDGQSNFLFTLDKSLASALDQGTKGLSQVQGPFAGAGYPLSDGTTIVVVQSGSLWTVVDDANLVTYALSLNGNVINVARKYLWPSITDVSTGNQLPAQQFQSTVLYTYEHAISDPMALQFDFGGLNIINKQNAWGGASVSRNAVLVENQQTMPNFVYQTPEAFFPNRVVPSLVITDQINLRDQPGSPTDFGTALSTFLTTLFAAQAQAAPSSIRTIKASARYSFDVAEGRAASPNFPLVLVSNYDLAVSNPSPTGPDAFGAAFATAISNAASQAGVPADIGRYSMTLTVYAASDGSTGLNPTVQYEDLSYALVASL
jgi:LysM repeat protein